MKKTQKIGFAAIVAGGMAASILGFAAPAQADLDHHSFIDQITPTVNVPHVDTSVHASH